MTKEEQYKIDKSLSVTIKQSSWFVCNRCMRAYGHNQRYCGNCGRKMICSYGMTYGQFIKNGGDENSLIYPLRIYTNSMDEAVNILSKYKKEK